MRDCTRADKSMRTEEKKSLIARAIYKLSKENPKQQFITHGQIVEETRLEFDTVDLYLRTMEKSGHVTGTRTFGGWIVALTAGVVLALESVGSQQAVTENIGFPIQKTEGDVHDFDRDNDGIACESLP